MKKRTVKYTILCDVVIHSNNVLRSILIYLLHTPLRFAKTYKDVEVGDPFDHVRHDGHRCRHCCCRLVFFFSSVTKRVRIERRRLPYCGTLWKHVASNRRQKDGKQIWRILFFVVKGGVITHGMCGGAHS